MVNVLVLAGFCVTLLGFLTFVLTYAILAKPWHTSMGRHIISFMAGILLALIYSALGYWLRSFSWYLYGWVGVYWLLAGLVWWRVVIFLKFQIQAQRLK